MSAKEPPIGDTRIQREVLRHELQKKLGAVPHALFFTTGEGHYFVLDLPTGAVRIEEASGFVITADERIYAWWLSADSLSRPYFSTWRKTRGRKDWLGSPEYVEARRKVGLVVEDS